MPHSRLLTRRAALGTGLAFAVGRASTVQAADGLRAVVTTDGQSFTYAAAAGKDLGDFRSEIGGFTQSCHLATDRAFPLTVMFRPDRGTNRAEVVFELGNLWRGETRNLGPYRVAIYDGAKQLAALDVPQHHWFSRWRWQSAPRPIVAKPVSLMAQGLLPPYETRNAPAPRPSAGASYEIMSLAGLEPRMGATGERPDIGLLTEHQAHYVCTGAGDALATLRAQAEAAGTLPWHMRDERTDAPVDLDVQAKMSWYPERPTGQPHIPLAKTGIAIDSAHQPALAYLPYLLTGDPYHLEDLQFAANFNRGTLPPDLRYSVPQTRALAWSLRTLAQAARVTPDKAPRWLAPRQYWQKDLDRTRAWFQTNYVESTDPARALFRSPENAGSNRADGPGAPEGTWISPWMDEFLASVFGWMVLMGHDAWRPAFNWKIGSTIARTDGHSGWVRARSTPYRLVIRPHKNAPYVKSWAEAWELTSRLNEWPPSDPNEIQGKDPTYYTYTRAALAFAVKLDVAGAKSCLAWMEDQLRNHQAPIAYKWRIA